MENDKKFVGKVIRKYRNYHNLSRKDLAEKLNVTDRQIEKYEYGKSMPPYKMMKKLHTMLDIPYTEFFPDIEQTKGYIAKTDEKIIKSGIGEILEKNPEILEVVKSYGKHSKELKPARYIKIVTELAKLSQAKLKQKYSLIMKYIKE